jgi:hypothetical protein
MARQRFSDDDEDDDRDDRRRDRRDDDDEDDDRPRRRDRRDEEDDYDDRPRAPKKPGLATAAGVLWVIWGGLGVISILFNVYALATPAYHQANIAVFGQKNADTMWMISVFQLVLVLGGTVLFLLAGIRTLTGGASSLGMFGGMTIAMCVVYFVVTIAVAVYQASMMEEVFGRMGGPGGRPPTGLMTGAGIVGGICGGLIGVTVPVLAGIFALSCNKKYAIWWRAARGRARYRG